ncbi:hypothetical protein C8R43DRAFT_1102571 [Mycena crocata]|nr:hypothetical protein C8R43DRAFT_1102571 [Mycena crocata]
MKTRTISNVPAKQKGIGSASATMQQNICCKSHPTNCLAENVRREFGRLDLKSADHYPCDSAINLDNDCRKWEQSIPSSEDGNQEGQRRVHCPSLTDVVAAGKEARLNMATLAARMEGDADLLPASRGIRSASLTNDF